MLAKVSGPVPVLFTVTVCAVLALARVKVSELGVAVAAGAAGAVAVPLRTTGVTAGVPAGTLTTKSALSGCVAAACAAVGWNWTPMTQLAPAAKGILLLAERGQTVPVRPVVTSLNALGVVPGYAVVLPRPTLLMVAVAEAAAPFDRVTTWAGVATPALVDPKLIAVGAMVRSGSSTTPVNVTV